jgi:aldose 1-epimerase
LLGCGAGTGAARAPAGEPLAAASPSAEPGRGEGAQRPSQHRVERDVFGSLGEQVVERYTLTNAHGLTLRVITLGAIITELRLPDRDGQFADVALGLDDVEAYLQRSPYFGALVGRVANRIQGAAFELDGRRYLLAANNGKDHLHGGKRGWDKLLWRAEVLPDAPSAAVRLELVSADGDEGYPGTVTASVTYTLTDDDELHVEMRAQTDRATLVNLAQHTYFNLGGIGSGSVLEHELTLEADAYTPGAPQIPNGRTAPVAGTPFDFRSPKALGKDLAATGIEPIGFDHNFVVRGEPHALRAVARLSDPRSGRVLTLAADQPGVQLYTGNYLDGSAQGKGVRYVQHSGVCLETQAFPNSIHVPAWRNDVIVRPGQGYQHHMLLRFSTEPVASGSPTIPPT